MAHSERMISDVDRYSNQPPPGSKPVPQRRMQKASVSIMTEAHILCPDRLVADNALM